MTLTQVQGHLKYAKDFFFGFPATNYWIFKQRCESVRFFAFCGIVATSMLQLFRENVALRPLLRLKALPPLDPSNAAADTARLDLLTRVRSALRNNAGTN